VGNPPARRGREPAGFRCSPWQAAAVFLQKNFGKKSDFSPKKAGSEQKNRSETVDLYSFLQPSKNFEKIAKKVLTFWGDSDIINKLA
jgi:hypothetical protein